MSKTQMTTGRARLSYVNVFTPKLMPDGLTEKYSVTLLIPKKDKATLKKMDDAIEAAKNVYKTKNPGKKLPANLQTTIHDGDGERPSGGDFGPECKGCMVLTVTSRNKPVVVGADKAPLTDPQEVYSGCYGRAVLNFYVYDTAGSIGVTAGLNGIMKLEDGEPLAGGVVTDSDWDDDFEDDDDLLGQMKTLAIDIETYSEIDLLKSGVYRYSEDPSFEILLLAYSVDGRPAEIVDLASGSLVPEWLKEALVDSSITKTAYNANFERTCISKYFGLFLPPSQWQDTMILAAELGLPRSLAEVGEVIGLPEDKLKMKEGKQLIQFFSKPCKATKVNGGRTRNLPDHDPHRWEVFKEYCKQDVDSEQAIRHKLLKFSFDAREQKLWEIDQTINDRGVGLDIEFAEAAKVLDETVKANLIQEAKNLTGMENPKSVSQIKNWIFDETGLVIDSLEKKEIKNVLEKIEGNAKVEEFLQLRSEFNKTSTAKYEAMLRCVSDDGRIRGLTQFYGANRTGRWAGRNVQMQNLPQNHLPDDELDFARELVRERDLDSLTQLFDPGDTLSQLIRTAFIPDQGKKFIVSDFSAIEARVLAWLADEKWRLEVFNTHGKIYEASAEQMFHLPRGSVRKGDPMRTKGKIAELALGYGGSVGALMSMGALENGLEENELKPLVDSWRRANPAIVKTWWEIDKKVHDLLTTGCPQQIMKGMIIRKQGPAMKIKLPSGRELSYIRPQLTSSMRITFEGQVQAGGWARQETYGAKLVENITQADARDCLAESIIRLEAEGIPVVFHVHDEVIVEVPETEPVQRISDIMAKPISWAKGLPLKADAYQCKYYRKD